MIKEHIFGFAALLRWYWEADIEPLRSNFLECDPGTPLTPIFFVWIFPFACQKRAKAICGSLGNLDRDFWIPTHSPLSHATAIRAAVAEYPPLPPSLVARDEV